MGKGAKGKIQNVRDADVAKFPGVDGTLMPNATEQSAASYVDKIRLEGKVPKQVDGFYRTFMPTRGYAQIASKHHLESTGTIEQVMYKNYKVLNGYDRKQTKSYVALIAPFIEKLPAGTNFVMKYSVTPEVGGEHQFGVFSTQEIDSKDRYNMERTMRTYLVTRIIPRLGKAILRDTTSKHDIKTSPYRDEAGVLHQVKVVCDECGGNFLRDKHGEYICMDCGLVYVKQNKTEVEDENGEPIDWYESEMTELSELQEGGDFDGEQVSVPENAGRRDSTELGSMSEFASEVETRLRRNKVAWLSSLENLPEDEVRAKQRLADDNARHERAKKAFAKMGGQDVYLFKWTKLQSKARKAKMLFFIKNHKLNTGELSEVMGIGSKQFYRLLEELEQEGRIALIKVKGVRSVSIKYIERPNYVPRVPKFKVAPVLLQVKYGNVQGRTINARGSKIL
jgi:transcription initiation factor TFIIIB Brf1 subunit/transcription initiation factor TFIIB